MKEVRFATHLGVFGSGIDRYVTGGYGEARTLSQLFEEAGKTRGLTGIELVGAWHLKPDNLPEIKKYLRDTNLKLVMIAPDLWGQAKWKLGSFTSHEEKIRRQAIDEVKKCIDLAAELGCKLVGPWFGQDGYDYLFETDYGRAWDFLIEGIRECVDYQKDIRLGIEYKIKEPRQHCHVAGVAEALLICQEVNRDNVGVILDSGHALQGYENLGESAALLRRFGNRLFHLHLNDNYRLWDDDLFLGSVHTLEYLEFFFWLEKTGYDGWYSFDIFPYRIEARRAVEECIAWVKTLRGILARIGMNKLEEIIVRKDPLQASQLIRETMSV